MMNNPSDALNHFYMFIMTHQTQIQTQPYSLPFNPPCLVLYKLTYLALAIKTV